MAGEPCPYPGPGGRVDPSAGHRFAGAILALLSLCTFPATARTDADTEWRFEPLGPEGAAVAEILSPGAESGLLRTDAGELYGWIPSGGAWEPVALAWESPVLRMAAVPQTLGQPTALILLANGALLRWQTGDHALGGESRPERMAGWVDPEMARSIVAILPAADEETNGFILLTRGGMGLSVTPDGSWERWQARFIEPGRDERGCVPDLGDRCGLRLRELFTDPADPRVIFALTEWEGLFMSRDGARRFAPVTGGLPKEVRTLCVLTRGRLCAACADGIYLSSDGGRTWTAQVNARSTPSRVFDEIRQLAASSGHPDHLLAITRNGQLLRSTDLGASWTRQLREIPVRSYALAGNPEGAIMRIGTSRGVLSSTDGGEVWGWENGGLRRVTVSAMGASAQGDQLYLGTDLGFYGGPADGQRWLPELIWTEGHAPHAAACPSEEVWARLSGSIFDLDVCVADNGDAIICTAGSDGLARCMAVRGDHGVVHAWSAPGPIRSSTTVLAETDAGLWAAGGEGFDIWTATVDAVGEWSESETRGDALWAGVQPNLAHAVLAGEACVLLAAGGLVNLSDELATLPLPAGREALALASAGGLLWLGTEAGLYRSGDGVVWTLVGFEEDRIGSLAAASGRADVLLIQADRGIYYSPDGGAGWLAVPAPDDLHVTGLGLDPLGRCAYLGTDYGLFAAHPPQIPTLQVSRPMPIEASPNPFSSYVQLRCPLPRVIEGNPLADLDTGDPLALPSAGMVGVEEVALPLRVISVHGQLVRRLSESEIVTAGSGERHHQWSWDGRNDRDQEVPNGIYLLSTRVGNQAYVGKVIKFR